MASSQNISLLNCVNSAIGMSTGGAVLALSIPQNCLGRFFNISGSLNCKSARLYLHCCANCFSAWIVVAWFFPYGRLARWNARFAFLHYILYHGARCLFHLFGLAAVLRLVFTSTTPALVASDSKNSSILAAQRSLDIWQVFETSVNASTNAGVVV